MGHKTNSHEPETEMMRGGGLDRYAREAGCERSKYTLYTCVELRTNLIFEEKKQLRENMSVLKKNFISWSMVCPNFGIIQCF